MSALSAGDLLTARDAECRYDLSSGAFLLKSPAPEATQTSKGTVFLGDQRITTANSAIDPNNDITFSGGRFTLNDGSGQQIAPLYTKQLDGVWTAGNNQGGLPVALLPKAASTWYNCFALYSPGNGTTDYGFDKSPAAFNLLADGNVVAAGITKYRRVGAVRTNSSSNIVQFYQFGKTFRYKSRIADITGGDPGTVGASISLTVPSGVSVIAILNIKWETASTRTLLITSLDDNNDPVTINLNTVGSGSNIKKHIEIFVKTDLLSNIRHRSSSSGSPGYYYIWTLGYIDETLEG